MKKQNNAPVTSLEKIDDIDLWVEVFREGIIETFKLTKFEVLLIIEKFLIDCVSENSCVGFEFPFFSMFDEQGKDFEDIIAFELKAEIKKINKHEKADITNFVEQFYQSISNLEKLQIISRWYTNGMFAPIIQTDNGIEIDEECELFTQSYYEYINEFKLTNKNK
jgi:hypothetical protein